MGAGGTARDLEAGFSEVSGPPQSCDAVGALGSAPGLRANGKKSVHPSLFLSIQIAKVHLGTHHVPAPTLCHHIEWEAPIINHTLELTRPSHSERLRHTLRPTQQ